MTDYTAIDNLTFEELKNLYSKVPKEIKDILPKYNVPNWESDNIAIIRRKLITIYKRMDSKTADFK